MKISIRKQLTIIFISLTAAVFLLYMLLNSFFLERYYLMRKQEVLIKAYSQLNENITDEGKMGEEQIEEFEDICSSNSISFIVTDQNYNRLIWTTDVMAETGYWNLMVGRLNGYGLGFDVAEDESILESNEKYTIQKKFDTVADTDYMEMWGVLDKGFYFIMRIDMESIRESVRISNDFVKYICLISMLFSGILVWAISRRVTRPLNELTELSKRMADLDFDVKYTGGGSDEIRLLGEHFNQMSEKLQAAYSQLLTANNELQKDIERKQQVDDMRKEFLSNVSHELKTPIALIQGYAEGLQECINDDAESREFYCEVIMDEAAKMNRMVQKLLTLNQLEFGNDQVVMERFDIASLIRNKIQSVSILAQQKEAEILYEGQEILPVWGDEYKVEEVLTNYLSNALNHVSGAHRIIVSAYRIAASEGTALAVIGSDADNERYAANEDRIRITVFNTGERIPEEDLKLIWDKFYKVDKARTREYGGSGVGLSIVKAIMESFHQQYGVSNCEDGVEFWFELRAGN